MSRESGLFGQTAARNSLSSTAILFVMLLMAAGAARAATYNVTTPVDGGPGSLRFAIINANATPGVDDITFDSGLGAIPLTGGHLEITESVVVRGPSGARQTVSGNNCSRIFRVVGDDVSLEVERMRLINGTGAAVCGGTGGEGGAIFADGELRIYDSVISNNTSGDPSITGVAMGGGGFSAEGGATIGNSLITNNEALSGCNAFGGGFYVLSGDVSLFRSVVSGNATSGCNSEGGGMTITYGTLVMINSIVTGNTTSGEFSPGAGIYANEVEMLGSTVSDNTILGENSSGAGLHVTDALLMTNSTVSGNSVSSDDGRAGGILLAGQDAVATIRNSTITDNSVDTVSAGLHMSSAGSELNMISSVLAGNDGISNLYSVVSTVNVEHSVFGDRETKINGSNQDNVFTDSPGLQALADNGCAQPAPDDCPQTHLPAAGSPVVNAGANPQGLSDDQRGDGFPRVRLGATDIGAVEGVVPILGLSTESINFATVGVGDDSAQDVVLANNGNADLDVGTLALSGNNPGEFSITSDGCSNNRITPGGDCSFTVVFQPSVTGSASASVDVPWNGPSSAVSVTGTGAEPAAAIAPSPIDFGPVVVGASSTTTAVTVTSTGNVNLTVDSVVIDGTDSSDFTIVGDACSGNTLPPGTDCVISVEATPSATGSRSAQITIPTSAPSSPDTVPLGVVGIQAGIEVVPGQVDFGDVRVDQASGAQGITIENTGSAALDIDPLALTGAHSGDYALPTDNCSGQSLAAGATCLVEVSVTPSATGARNADIVISSNAPTSPDAIPLSTTGVAPSIDLSPSALDFGDVRVGDVSSALDTTIENTGSASLNIDSIITGGMHSSDFTIQADACTGQSLAPGANCQVEITVTPDATGTRSGEIVIVSDASSSPGTVSLAATGIESAVVFTPNAVDFEDVRTGQESTAQSVSIENSGTADLNLDTVSLTGTDAGEFSVASDNCSGQTLLPSASCLVELTVTPADTGATVAELRVRSDAPTSPDSIALQADGVEPGVALTPASLDFGDVRVGEPATTRSVEIENTGTADLSVDSVSPSGPDTADFAVESETCTGQPVNPGATCRVDFAATPSAVGSLEAEFEIRSDAPEGPVSIPLQVNGVEPVVTLNAATLEFGQIEAGEAESAQATVTNTGSADLLIENVVEPAEPFAIVGGTCMNVPVTLAPGEACDIAVELAPRDFGRRFTGEIGIVSNADSTPHTISLNGGTTPLAVPALHPIALGLLSLLAMLIGCTVVRRVA